MAQCTMGQQLEDSMEDKYQELDNKVSQLRKMVQDTGIDITALDDHQRGQESGKTIQSQDPLQRTMEAMRLEVGERQQDIGDKSLKCSLKSDKMEEVVGKIADALTMADQIQFSLISKELPEWRRRQQVACIGGPNNTCLDQLQSWFTSVAESLKQVQQQLRKLQELVKTFTHDNNPVAIDIGALEERAVMQLNNLLASALVVERQPCNPTQPQRPLVIMQIVQFTVKLRFLLKLPELDGLLKVKVSLDEDAVQYNTIQGFRKFNILGRNTRVMNMEESNGNLTAEFRHLVQTHLTAHQRWKNRTE